MIALWKYHFITYFKSSKFIMPLAIYVIFMIMMCGGSGDVNSIFLISAVASYFFMAWSSFVFSDCEELIAEQIAILKAGNNKKFYLSKNIFIASWGIIYSMLGVLIPILWKVVGMIFPIGEIINLGVGSILTAFLAHICACILGAAVGFIWHPRIMANRKVAAMGAFSFAVMGVVNGPLSEDIAAVGGIKWIFPPIYYMIEKMGMGESKLALSQALIPMVLCLGYAAILVIANVIVLHKKGF